MPAGSVLTNDEIKIALEALNQLKLQGATGPDLVDRIPESYTISMPVVGTAISKADLLTGVTMLNRAAGYRNSDLLFTWHDGAMVKRGYITIKGEANFEDRPSFELGGTSFRKEF